MRRAARRVAVCPCGGPALWSGIAACMMLQTPAKPLLLTSCHLVPDSSTQLTFSPLHTSSCTAAWALWTSICHMQAHPRQRATTATTSAASSSAAKAAGGQLAASWQHWEGSGRAAWRLGSESPCAAGCASAARLTRSAWLLPSPPPPRQLDEVATAPARCAMARCCWNAHSGAAGLQERAGSCVQPRRKGWPAAALRKPRAAAVASIVLMAAGRARARSAGGLEQVGKRPQDSCRRERAAAGGGVVVACLRPPAGMLRLGHACWAQPRLWTVT